MTVTAPQPVIEAPVARPTPARVRAHRAAFAGLLVMTGVLYLWNLSANGWANSFYSAAVQASSKSATAFLFGSSDAANAITVDKTPGALWVMDASVRLFGFNSWSVLAPQALEGVAAVALLYAAIRRINGPAAGLLAGTVLALTPVATLMFRFNNPDALLVLLLVAAAYCVQRAGEDHSGRWWLPLAGAAVGFAFLAKMGQALVVVPGFVAAYLLSAHSPLRTRVTRILAAGGALLVSGGWYLVLVALWPADRRPYIGGSAHNSIVELALGYNGLGRLTGDEPGGLGNPNFDVGAVPAVRRQHGHRDRLAHPGVADLRRGRAAHHPTGAAHQRHSRCLHCLGRLAGSDRCGHLVLQRHHSPLLHRCAGPGHRGRHRHRRAAPLAAA